MKNKVVIIGMPGSGKTTIGKILSRKLNLEFYDMDEYIQEKTGKTIAQIFENGEEHFRDIESEVCRELCEKKNVLISTGGGVVKRKENMKIFDKESVVIFLDRPLDKILNDVDTSKRPLLKEGKEKLQSLYNERYNLYKEAAHKIIVNDKDIEHIIKEFELIIKSTISK